MRIAAAADPCPKAAHQAVESTKLWKAKTSCPHHSCTCSIRHASMSGPTSAARQRVGPVAWQLPCSRPGAALPLPGRTQYYMPTSQLYLVSAAVQAGQDVPWPHAKGQVQPRGDLPAAAPALHRARQVRASGLHQLFACGHTRLCTQRHMQPCKQVSCTWGERQRAGPAAWQPLCSRPSAALRLPGQNVRPPPAACTWACAALHTGCCQACL